MALQDRCLFVKFKSGGGEEGTDLRMKLKRTPYSKWYERMHVALGESAVNQWENHHCLPDSPLGGTTARITKTRSVCLMAHHLSTLIRGIEELSREQYWARFEENVYVYYDFREEKNRRYVRGIMARGGLAGGVGLAQKIEKAVGHQHLIYLRASPALGRDLGEKTELVGDPIELGKGWIYDMPSQWLAERVLPFLRAKKKTSIGGLFKEGFMKGLEMLPNLARVVA